jgi:cellulose synthase/poly-beta-1,6-N-acetylglucosamine synthase-like glycosyltransferase
MTEFTPGVSVVVPTYNAEATIGPLLDSLTHLDYPDYEVIIVNDGSRDQTREIVKRYPVRLIDQPNRGASAARDAGLRASSREIVAYVDSDVTVTRDWLRKIVQAFSDPTVGAATGQTVFLRDEKATSWLRSLDIERRNAGRRTFTRLANGPNSAFRRSLLLEVGGFDPSWYHAEDTEVSYRIWQRGSRIRYVPEAVVHHVPEGNWRTFFRKRYRDAKAFTRMLRRYSRSAILEDDFVTTSMKIQPPVFLVLIVTAIVTAILQFTPYGYLSLLCLSGLFVFALLLNMPEVLAMVRASGRTTFFFRGLGLSLLRGFAWGAGLGAGGLRQVIRA